ncbi:MAG TPA: DUF4439 domain-containing protein [Nocardioides sp.]|nr:DUF4439 domain-containing protein [Nocardioides sp.]
MTTSGLDALQRTLAGEHAAVFVLAALGGRASALTAPSLRTALDAAYDAHLQRRDRLRVMVVAAGGDPVAAEPAYRLPGSSTGSSTSPSTPTAAQIQDQALQVERGCATAYAALVAATAGADRRWAVDALVETAVGEAAFGGTPEALPGVGTPDP